MTKDPKVFLQHILESIDWINEYLKDVSIEKFEEDNATQDAVIRRFEIIGEAARNIPEDIKKNSPGINWQEMMDTRNKLIHEYFGIEFDIVWDTVKNDLPRLKKQITELLRKL